jgi:hypothetical protein
MVPPVDALVHRDPRRQRLDGSAAASRFHAVAGFVLHRSHCDASKGIPVNPNNVTKRKSAFATAANLRLQHVVEGSAGGGLVGAAIGAGGGFPGALAGAILGGIAGAMAGAAADSDASRRAARTRELDA